MVKKMLYVKKFSWQRYLSVFPTDTKRKLFICFSRLDKKGYKNVFQ